MNAESATVDTARHATPRTVRRHRRSTALAGVALAALLGLTACSSDPSARRVAQDLIETAFEEGDLSESERDCMLERLDAYSDGELEDITNSADVAGPGTPIDMFESDLAGCR